MKLISNTSCDTDKYYIIYRHGYDWNRVSLVKWNSVFTKLIFAEACFKCRDTGDIILNRHFMLSAVDSEEVLMYELTEDEIYYYVTLQSFVENV